MSTHEPKVPLAPRSPRATLDALCPWGKSIYGTDIRLNDTFRLRRTDTVGVESLYKKETSELTTGWILEKSDGSAYAPKFLGQGHFHTVDLAVVGFCPNEQLPFNEVNKIIGLLTQVPVPA